MKDQSQRI